ADPAAPKRLARYAVAGSWSEAESDPHALLWWPATRLLVLPIGYGATDGALALRVTDAGLTKVATITQPRDADRELNRSPGLRRTLVVGETFWTVSDYGLQAY